MGGPSAGGRRWHVQRCPAVYLPMGAAGGQRLMGMKKGRGHVPWAGSRCAMR